MAMTTGTANTMNALITAINNFISQNAKIGTVVWTGTDPNASGDQMIIFSMTQGANTIYYSLSAKNSLSPSRFQSNVSTTYSTSVGVTSQPSSALLFNTSGRLQQSAAIPIYANQSYQYWLLGGQSWMSLRIVQNSCHESLYFGFLDTTTTGYGGNAAVLTSTNSAWNGINVIDNSGSANYRSPLYTSGYMFCGWGYGTMASASTIALYDFKQSAWYAQLNNTNIWHTNFSYSASQTYATRIINLNNHKFFTAALSIPVMPALAFEYNASTTPNQSLPIGYFNGLYATPSAGLQDQYTFSIGTNNYIVFFMLSGANSSSCLFNGFAEVFLTNG